MVKKNLAMLGLAGFATALFGAGLLGGNANALEFVSETYTLSSESPVTDGIVVNEGQEVTINLGGTTVSNTTGKAVIINKGKLTITGEGTVNTASAGAAAVLNYPGAELTINGGSYNSTNFYTVKNFGAINIAGGTFTQGENNTSNSSLIANGWYDGKGTAGADMGVAYTEGIATMTINDGTFTHNTTTSAIKSDDYSKTTINGGNFESKQGFLAQVTGDVTINGGKFTGFNSFLVFNADGSTNYEPGAALITGGDVKAAYMATVYGYASLNVEGGNFSDLEGFVKEGKLTDAKISGGVYGVEPAAEMIKAGYKAQKNADGKFEIVLNVTASDKTDNKDTDSNEKTLGDVAGDVIAGITDGKTENNGSKFEAADGVDDDTLKAALGGAMSIELESDGTYTLTAEEDAAVKAELANANATVLDAYDVVVVLRDAADNELGKVTELPKALKVVLRVDPANKVAEGYTRIWRVIRIHNGALDILDAAYDEANGILTTESDKFSTFVPYYIDVKNTAEEPVVPGTPNTGLFTDRDGKGTDATAVIVTLTAAVTALALAVYAIKTTRR